MVRTLIAAALLLGFVAVPASAQQEEPLRSIPMLVTAEWLSERLDSPDLVVIQVDQSREGYDQGHIPGATFLPYEDIAVEVDGLPVEMPPVYALVAAFARAGLRNLARVVVYGEPLSAARAWMTLDYLGIGQNVAMLDGGIDAWQAAGYEVTTEVGQGMTGALSISPQLERIVDAEWVLEQVNEPYTAIIDARPLEEYTGADGGRNGQFLAGHIPGARHLYWEELIHSREDPRLLPEEELRAKFEAAGAVDDKIVVVYCFIGMRASMAYFVSRMLGYETHIYDGSWHDWSARGLPVESGPDPNAPTSR
jgi:thiosulfate/3-mercaptopyruvate sulfurtransferase